MVLLKNHKLLNDNFFFVFVYCCCGTQPTVIFVVIRLCKFLHGNWSWVSRLCNLSTVLSMRLCSLSARECVEWLVWYEKMCLGPDRACLRAHKLLAYFIIKMCHNMSRECVSEYIGCLRSLFAYFIRKMCQ